MEPVGTSDNTAYKKPGVVATIGGVMAGSTVSSLVLAPVKRINPKLMNNVKQLSAGLTADELVKVQQAVTSTVENTGLSKKVSE